MTSDNLESWVSAVPLMRTGYHREMLRKVAELRKTQIVYPPEGQVLHALALTPFDAVSVVIVGQDPYHAPGQAHGLAFSVPEGVKRPPSLRNILKEVSEDVYDGALPEASTDLTRWADQGVLLLNASLTVEAGRAGSHSKLGWIPLTDAIISQLSSKSDALVFLLWGRYALSKKPLIDVHRHQVLEAPHPSPLSAYRGFFGCRHFSQANAYFERRGRPSIVW